MLLNDICVVGGEVVKEAGKARQVRETDARDEESTRTSRVTGPHGQYGLRQGPTTLPHRKTWGHSKYKREGCWRLLTGNLASEICD